MKPLLLAIIRCVGRIWCRMHGAEVASSALIHGFPKITRKNGGRIIIGHGVTLNASKWANPLNDSRGMRLHAAEGAIIRFFPGSGASNARIIAYSGVSIGENSFIGSGCLICDSDMHEVPLGCGAAIKTAPIHIGKQTFIGADSIILKGVNIGDASVIGAGSVVTHHVPPLVMAAGNPLVVRKTFGK